MSISKCPCWWTPYQEIGDIAVAHINLTPHPEHEALAFSLLDDEERSRCRKFEHPAARRRFVLCRAALRTILCDELGCTNGVLSFGELRYGKPIALVNGEAARVGFNVSHSGRHGLIAVAPEGRLGVDVEQRTARRDFDRLIEAAFGPNEQADLKLERRRGEFQLFFKLWTVKEALIKALGTGLSLDPSEFEVPPAMRLGGAASTFRFPQVPEVRWQVEDIGNEQFAAALAFDV